MYSRPSASSVSPVDLARNLSDSHPLNYHQWDLDALVGCPLLRRSLVDALHDVVAVTFSASAASHAISKDREFLDFVIECIAASLEDMVTLCTLGPARLPRSVPKSIRELRFLEIKHGAGNDVAMLWKDTLTSVHVPSEFQAAEQAVRDFLRQKRCCSLWSNRRRARVRQRWVSGRSASAEAWRRKKGALRQSRFARGPRAASDTDLSVEIITSIAEPDQAAVDDVDFVVCSRNIANAASSAPYVEPRRNSQRKRRSYYRKIDKIGTPVVVSVSNGRPHVLEDVVADIPGPPADSQIAAFPIIPDAPDLSGPSINSPDVFTTTTTTATTDVFPPPLAYVVSGVSEPDASNISTITSRTDDHHFSGARERIGADAADQDRSGTHARRLLQRALQRLSYQGGQLYGFSSSVRAWRRRFDDARLAGDYCDWDLDPIPNHRLDIEALIAMATRDAPDQLLPLLLLTNEELFDSLFVKNGDVQYVGKSRGMSRFVAELVEAQVWEPCARRDVGTFITAFVIPKPKKRKLRLICNAIPLNNRQRRLPDYLLRLPRMEDIKRIASTAEVYTELDGISYYNQFPLPEYFRRHLVIRVGARNYRWMTLPMGWESALDVAHAASTTLQTFEAISIPLTYVDNLFRFGLLTDVQADTATLRSRASEANVLLETVAENCTKGDILGMHMDLTNKTVCLPLCFVEKFTEVVKCFAAMWALEECCSYRDVWTLVGNVIWGLRVLEIPLFRARSTIYWLRNASRSLALGTVTWETHVLPPKTVQTELLQLGSSLLDNAPISLPSVNSPLDRTELFTDACESGWGVVWFDGTKTVIHKGVFPPFLRDEPIAIKELWAVLKGIQKVKGQHLRLYCDNTNVVAWVRKWHANPPLATSLLRRLHRILGNRSLDMVWIPSESNVADKPSRFRELGAKK